MTLANTKISNFSHVLKMPYEKENKPKETFKLVFKKFNVNETKFLDIMEFYFRELGDPEIRTMQLNYELNGTIRTPRARKIKGTDYWVHHDSETGDFSIHQLYAQSPKGGEPELWSKILHGDEFPEFRVKKSKEDLFSGSIYEMRKNDGTLDSVSVAWDDGKTQKLKDLSKIIFEWKEDYEYFSQFFPSKG